MSERGRFITVEGVEGAGKSTHIELIKAMLEEAGIEVLATREPGGTSIGEKIRAIFVDRAEQQMTALTELLLMFAARAQHVHEVIEPALTAGIWVLSDRFTDSSYAYQGGGRMLPTVDIEKLDKLVLGGLQPELTLLLDLGVKTGLARAARVKELDRVESEDDEFFERVRTMFLRRAQRQGLQHRYNIVDASRPLADVRVDVVQIIRQFLGQTGNG